MSNYAGLSDLVEQIKQASANIRVTDERNGERLAAIEQSINELFKKAGRPGGYADFSDTEERKSAIGLCQIHKSLVAEGDATAADYTPGSTEIQAAVRARQGLKALFRTGSVDRIEPEFRKALSSFSFGNNGFILAPGNVQSRAQLLIDPTDVSGLVDSIAISGPSIRFLIDNARMVEANWACEQNCFSNNPQADLSEGLGELDFKPETLRYVVCATSDLLADAAFNVEAWILDKVSRGFRATINAAILLGDGIGKPQGLWRQPAASRSATYRPQLRPGNLLGPT